MLSVFKVLKSFAILKKGPVVIDTIYSWFFYKFTTTILGIFCILVTYRHFTEENISCISDKFGGKHAINSYCFSFGTYTIHNNISYSLTTDGIYPGVGHYNENEHVIREHRYYQWVPWFLFFKLIIFYLPHRIWKDLEDGTMASFVSGLEFAHMTFQDERVFRLRNGAVVIPSREQRTQKLKIIRDAFLDRGEFNKNWFYKYISCELLNPLVLFALIFLTNVFLGYQFVPLGFKIIASSEHLAPVHNLFPKMSKCTFRKFGPSGSLQNMDALCILPMNYYNAVIFPILWIWYFILSIITVIYILLTISDCFLHSRSGFIGVFVKIDKWYCKILNKQLRFGDWLFLHFLSKNMDVHVFHEFVELTIEKLRHETRNAETMEEALFEDRQPLNNNVIVADEQEGLRQVTLRRATHRRRSNSSI